jgi:hypothetical protein
VDSLERAPVTNTKIGVAPPPESPFESLRLEDVSIGPPQESPFDSGRLEDTREDTREDTTEDTRQDSRAAAGSLPESYPDWNEPPADVPRRPSIADLPLSARYALGGIPALALDRPGAPVSGELDPFVQGPPTSSTPSATRARDASAADRAVEDLLGPEGNRQVKAQWRAAHPSARKWAAKREREDRHITGRTPKPLRIMLGFVIVGIASYLAFVVLPTRQPLSQSERTELSTHAGVDADAWRFGPQLYAGALGAVGMLGLVGVAVVMRGALYRRRVKVKCRKCKTHVLAEPHGFGFRCTAGHIATSAPAKVMLLILFLASGAALGALTVIASLG